MNVYGLLCSIGIRFPIDRKIVICIYTVYFENVLFNRLLFNFMVSTYVAALTRLSRSKFYSTYSTICYEKTILKTKMKEHTCTDNTRINNLVDLASTSATTKSNEKVASSLIRRLSQEKHPDSPSQSLSLASNLGKPLTIFKKSTSPTSPTSVQISTVNLKHIQTDMNLSDNQRTTLAKHIRSASGSRNVIELYA